MRRVKMQAMQGIVVFWLTLRTIDENHSDLDCWPNTLLYRVDLSRIPLTIDSYTWLKILRLSLKSWRLVKDIVLKLKVEGFIDTLAMFVRESRCRLVESSQGDYRLEWIT